ncbi:MAG: sugar ABC transporter ATP-binding protein [Propionicimonas sp.]
MVRPTTDLTVLATRGLSKDYGPVRVLSEVSVEFRAGRIHALLGENGAGKSTLIKLIAGITAPSQGELLLDGRPYLARSVHEGQQLGIVALPQELSLVPTLGVAENIFLGMREHGRRGLIDRRRLNLAAAEQLARLGQQLPLDRPVGELSAVEQTMVALARALARRARVLILDEPTAALTDTETEQLFGVLRSLRAAGTAIVYVSHRLDEVFALADTATVLRNGRLVWTRPIEQTSSDDVVSAMIGRAHGQVYPPRATIPGEPVLTATGLVGHTLRGVSLAVRAGRVLGIAGLAGAGRSELLKQLAGLERPSQGSITLDGEDVTAGRLAHRMALGVVLVPEERRRQGLVMNDTVQANIALANLSALSVAGVALPARERATARRQVDALRITATSVRQPVAELSGGNQQKVVLAKYLERRPRVLLLDEPTRGIDIGTKTEIYQLIRELAERGVAVVVVSSEIPELIGLADDLAVLHEGTLTGVLAAAQATPESVLRLCYRKPAA